MQKGKINVQTDNIFPIIKKFLYSDHEIFLRELISNAIDATQKLKTLSLVGDFKGEMGDLSIEVIADEKGKTLTVRDRGIGMSAEEVEKYINQIAFSGAEEFIKKFKDKAETNIIGHFGLGFYSSFMVADKVEIITKSYLSNSKAVKWTCDGSPDYTLEETKKKDRGTEIILYLNNESKEFCEDARITLLLRKYCKFLPVEIKHKGQVINNTKPAWTQKPAELKDDDYKNFYKVLYPMAEDPLFWIHLNVDYPFKLTGVLYFPKLKNNFEVQKNKIQLFCNQVFVTDSVEGIVPEFLMLLHGVLDSPDIPLNVSRSYLQSDPNVKKISSHISKKVADKLEEMFKNSRKDFENKWDDIKIFIEYGMITEEKFYERAEKFCLLKNVDSKYFTFEEYKKIIELNQTDKDKNLIYLYANHKDEQFSYIDSAKNKGYDVLLFDSMADNHFINNLEMKLDKSRFARVDSDTVEKIINKSEKNNSKLIVSEKDQKQILPILEKIAPKENYTISFEGLNPSDQPIIITKPEFSRRMKDMAAMGGMEYMKNMPDQLNLVVNTNHSLLSKILVEPREEKQNQLLQQAMDLALLSQNLLRGEELSKFIKRSVEMIN